MKSIKKIIWSVLNTTFLGGLIQLRLKSALKQDGWFRSFQNKRSIDASGNSIPWYTYSFIRFIENRLNKTMLVFEYGCGGSTFWLAERTKQVIAVEDNREWKNFVDQKKAANVQILLQEIDTNQSYSKSILQTETLFDIIVVDGKERNSCVVNALNKISDKGVVIIDNSDRSEYEPSYNLLKEQGFKRLDFWGMTPIIADNSCTSVFYKNNNCLNI